MEPSFLIAQVCKPPTLIAWTVVNPLGAAPELLRPQQTEVPSLLMAHEWEPPELSAMRVPSVAVGLACPSVLRPQQAAVPSLLMAHVWDPPALIALKVVLVGGVLSP